VIKAVSERILEAIEVSKYEILQTENTGIRV